MNKAVVNLIIKVGKKVIDLISTQIINYLSSEEFSNRVKIFIEDMVSQLVVLVIAEKNKTINKL